MAFVYPQNYEISAIMPQLQDRGLAGRVGLELCPIKNTNASQVRWIQEDDYYGLQQMRGMDGAPTHVQRVGSKTFVYEPAIFGEVIPITEQELTTRAGSAPIDNTPIDVSELVLNADQQLINREYDRMESSVWTLFTTGTLSIKLDGPNGTQVAYTDTYPIQTYSASIPWSTVATATPLSNIQSAQQLSVGYSVDFGPAAKMYLNRVTANRMLNNTNASDLGGRRLNNGGTINSMADINTYFLGQGLPQIVVYDQGYRNKIGTTGSTNFTKFIPDGKFVLVGARPGNARLAEYQVTRNLNNPNGAPGSYRYVKDYANGINAEKRTPPNIEIHRGHSGGISLYYPSAVVVGSV